MIETFIQLGYDISIFHKKKYVNGNIQILVQWRAKRCDRLKELTNDNAGFQTAGEAIKDLITKITNYEHEQSQKARASADAGAIR